MRLNQEELEQFNQNGFLILRDFADKKECDAILDIVKVHIKYQIEPIEREAEYHNHSKEYRTNIINYNSTLNQGSIRRLRQVYSRDIIFKNWMENRKIRPILEQILDDQVVITTAHHNSIMTKMPKESSATNWHQDRRYWSFTDNNLVSIWLALGEENSKNGILEFIPKSHKMNFSSNQFDSKEYFRDDYKQNMSLIETKVSTTLKKGDIIIFHSCLLHRANKNMTNKPKISFVYTVKGASTRAIEGSRSLAYPEILLDRT